MLGRGSFYATIPANDSPAIISTSLTGSLKGTHRNLLKMAGN